MSYYAKRRYNPPEGVYSASTLAGLHTGKNALTRAQLTPSLDADLQQFRKDRAGSSAADSVRARLSTTQEARA